MLVRSKCIFHFNYIAFETPSKCSMAGGWTKTQFQKVFFFIITKSIPYSVISFWLVEPSSYGASCHDGKQMYLYLTFYFYLSHVSGAAAEWNSIVTEQRLNITVDLIEFHNKTWSKLRRKHNYTVICAHSIVTHSTNEQMLCLYEQCEL